MPLRNEEKSGALLLLSARNGYSNFLIFILDAYGKLPIFKIPFCFSTREKL